MVKKTAAFNEKKFEFFVDFLFYEKFIVISFY